jgi:1,4-dihydroxy-2-naphthoyl-CoA hydrolase
MTPQERCHARAVASGVVSAPTQEASARFAALYGLEGLACSPEEVRGRIAVVDALRQPMGLVHGGVLACMADGLATLGTCAGVQEGLGARVLTNASSFLRPLVGDTVDGTATRVHRGRSTWVWDVTLADAAGRVCTVTRVTVRVS